MRNSITLAVAVTVAIAGTLPAAAQSGKKSAGGSLTELEPCPQTAASISAALSCTCDRGGALGSVWGSGPYTADSNLCAAATHGGAIPASGGPITVAPRPGQDSYTGSAANGVTTNSWGSYGSSFAVAALGASPPQPASTPGLPACTRMPDGVDQHACACPANPSIGSLWGNGPYTADSDICAAAVHSGYLAAEDGGEVYVLRIQGLESYLGGDSFGVTSSDWGSFGSSIVFDWNR